MPDEKLAIQVSYSIKDVTTYNREVPPLAKYAKAHEDWKCLLITYDEEGTEEGILVMPVWKWLMGCKFEGKVYDAGGKMVGTMEGCYVLHGGK